MTNSITILMTTWLPGGEATNLRLEAIETALRSWRDRLEFGGRIDLHVADDGSSEEDFGRLQNLAIMIWRRGKISWSQQHRLGLGASLTVGLGICLPRSPIVFHAVDDWELLSPLDLTPWVNFMTARDDVGMVRFFPHPNLRGVIEHTPFGMAVRLLDGGFVFGLRPALWHRRLVISARSNGMRLFKEHVSALECEADFNERLQADTYRPTVYLALPEQWRPVESVELSAVQPGVTA